MTPKEELLHRNLLVDKLERSARMWQENAAHAARNAMFHRGKSKAHNDPHFVEAIRFQNIVAVDAEIAMARLTELVED